MELTRPTAGVRIAMMRHLALTWIPRGLTPPHLVPQVHTAPNTAPHRWPCAAWLSRAPMSIPQVPPASPTVQRAPTTPSREPILHRGVLMRNQGIMLTNRANTAKKCALPEPTIPVRVQPQTVIASSHLLDITLRQLGRSTKRPVKKEPTSPTRIQPHASMRGKVGMQTVRGIPLRFHAQVEPTLPTRPRPTKQIASRSNQDIMLR